MQDHWFQICNVGLVDLLMMCDSTSVRQPHDLGVDSAEARLISRQMGFINELKHACSAAPFLKPYAVPLGNPAFCAIDEIDSLTLLASRGSAVHSPVPCRHLTNLQRWLDMTNSAGKMNDYIGLSAMSSLTRISARSVWTTSSQVLNRMGKAPRMK